jgi:hypothetical protein
MVFTGLRMAGRFLGMFDIIHFHVCMLVKPNCGWFLLSSVYFYSSKGQCRFTTISHVENKITKNTYLKTPHFPQVASFYFCLYFPFLGVTEMSSSPTRYKNQRDDNSSQGLRILGPNKNMLVNIYKNKRRKWSRNNKICPICILNNKQGKFRWISSWRSEFIWK